MAPLRCLWNRGERGASGVEYGLVAALILVGITSSLELIDERVEANYQETANDIGQQDLDYFEVTTTAGQATSTTATSTTAAPTTTTVPAGEYTEVSWQNRSSWSWNCYCYRARARIYLDDDQGDNLVGATVTVTFTLSGGSQASGTKTTNSYGRVQFSWLGLSASDFPVTVAIDSVTKEGVIYNPDVDEHHLIV